MERHAALLSLSLLFGCQTLRPSDGLDAGAADTPASDSSIPASSGPFRHAVLEGGVVETVVDATSETDVRYLDLESGLAITPTEPSDDDGWDVGFRRFFVTTNGGVSGSGGAASARLPSVAFDDVAEAPEDGYVVDAADIEEDDDSGTETAFNGGPDAVNDWYDYDPATHRLTPRAVTHVVRTVEGHFFKIQMLGYYDAVGTPGSVRFRWARIDGGTITLPDAGPPARPDGGADAGRDGGTPPLDAIDLDASSRTDWTYYRVGEGVVDVLDPSSSSDWDLRFRRTVIGTNSGTSGPGAGGARSLGEVAFEDVLETPTDGFTEDEITPPAMPGGEEVSSHPLLSSWFDYDPASHTVSPMPLTYAVRTASGGYAKLRIWAWSEGIFTLQIASIVPVGH